MSQGGSSPGPAVPAEVPGGTAGTAGTEPDWALPPERILRKAMAARFIEDATGGVAGHPVAGAAALVLFMDLVGPTVAFFWFGCLLVATGLRVWYGMKARRMSQKPLEAREWAFKGAIVVALAWGLGGLLFGTVLPREQLGILLVILAGLVAAATATLVADRSAFYGFSTILLGSIFLSVAGRAMGLGAGLGLDLTAGLLALILTFWVVMSVLYRRSNRQLAEQMEIRRALKSAQEQYQGLVESARDLVWQVDREGRWTFLNSAAKDIYGVEPADLLGEVSMDHAHEDHIEKDYQAFRTVLEGNELVDHETVHLGREGEKHYLSFSARPLKDPAGEIRGALGTARDVTDRVEAREALEEVAQKNSLVRSLINGSEDLIYFKDGEGVYQGCNFRFADSLGRSEEEVVGRTDEELVGPTRAAAYRRSDMEALTSWDPVRFEEWIVDRNGNRRLFETVKTVFRHVEGKNLGVLGVVRDVTERKEAEERMRDLAEKAERATRMKSAFLANMSHEIRTPMNGVLGMTEILLDTELSEEQHQYLQVIRSSGESLLGVLNDILDISKIEAGHLELEETSFDLNEEVLGAVALFSHNAVERNSELMVDLRPEVPRGVKGDPTRIRQVLSNLVGNAVKFTHEGEILVSVSRAGGTDERPRIRFSVRDTGVGIPKEKQESIFQEFTQADSSTTRHYGGTGLGLTISRHLVSLMGGTLHLESEEGVGSEFYFTLALPSDPEFAPAPEPGAQIDLHGIKALIVDDLETNRRIFRDFLETAGARVQVTESAQEALSLLRTLQAQDPFDFVILDLLMPGRDGFQLAEDIRLDPELRDLPLMVLTSSNRPGDRKLAARLRIEGFLQKPVSRAELLRGVHAVLGERLASAASSGQEDSAAPASEPGVPPGSGRSRSKELTEGLKVLVAEDNLVNQQVAMGLLQRWGCEVRVVGNGVETLEALEAELPDLILMDIQMPEMDGLEATRRIRSDERFEAVPILALTAHVLPEERQRCEDVGMNDYVPKPFKPGELRERVEHWARMGGKVSAPGMEASAGIGEEPPEDTEGASKETDPGAREDSGTEMEAVKPLDPGSGTGTPSSAAEMVPEVTAESLPDVVPEMAHDGELDLDVAALPDVRDLQETEPAPDTPPVLLEEFRAVMREAGIESVVDSAVEAYLDETPERMEALEAAVKAGDMKAVQREAHGMKSGSRNIRADDLAEQLEVMEIAGKEGRTEDVLSAMPELRESFERVLDYLKTQGPAS